MKVYTKRGDDGTTGLLYGGRVDKDDLRTSAYGTVDETCSALGLARAELSGEAAERVLEVQRELFVVGAQLATLVEHWDRLVAGVSLVDDAMVDALDARIDASVDRHPLPTTFVVPGGNRAAAALDLARTVCRRAEREVVAMKRADLLPDDAPLRYLNRCADLLYVLAREAEGTHVPSRTDPPPSRTDPPPLARPDA
ncbi:cob(I)yrinic acid a,c-diamide adenosyltransferase [Nitriliruptoraceae bacterium ZYF776]|nr:cob(I)yrinic acid a,c-diamide adenosyltransferase [Profundirhabdus halotolerans]